MVNELVREGIKARGPPIVVLKGVRATLPPGRRRDLCKQEFCQRSPAEDLIMQVVFGAAARGCLPAEEELERNMRAGSPGGFRVECTRKGKVV